MKEFSSVDYLEWADAWLVSAFSWASRHNKTQTVAALRQYDEAIQKAFAFA
jgi:hypothetical protein